ncbi:hypothetical protein P7C70_g6104, partial [Phenoliferia sp. Uapishka_3]
LLRSSLLLAIRTTLSKPSSSNSFPMPASSLYSTYILPFRPAYATSADIKGSSFKKLAQFIKAMVKAGYIVAKEVKGEWVVMSVNSGHADVLAARSYKTIAQAGASAEKEKAAGTTGAPGSSSSGATSNGVIVRELYKPTPAILALIPDSTPRFVSFLLFPSFPIPAHPSPPPLLHSLPPPLH